jgi:hypothetical protein
MQREYSHGNNVCPATGAAAAGSEKPENCLADANNGASQCGPAIGATCTGSHGLGKCCSSTGWCGNDPEFCGEGMQAEYSNAKNLCKEELPEGQQSIASAEAKCMTVEQVAVAWVSAIAPLSKTDAKSMCVPAVAVAAGSTFNSPLCADKFDPTVEAPGYQTTLKGLWQIAEEVFEPDPKKQAATAYQVYSGSNETYGCNAEWCTLTQTGCSEGIPGIGQDLTCENREGWESTCHTFCKGVWSGAAASIPIKLAAMGGISTIEEACGQAAKGIMAWAAVRRVNS